nr:hypothetical protein [Flavobacterium sp.]
MNKTTIQFIKLSFLFVLITEISNKIIDIKNILRDFLSEFLTAVELNNYFEFQDKWHWISYFFIPLYILLKTAVITSIIYIGVLFFSKNKITFKNIWNIILKAEFIFLLVPISKVIWFYFFKTNYTLEDIQYFYPLSALNIVGYKGLEPWFIYPFQVLNLFELAYWLILAYYIGKATETDMDHGLKIVAYSYGPALLLWVVTIMFFTLNYS